MGTQRYLCMVLWCYFCVPEHRSMHISGSFDLFPQHCIMPTFTPEQHAREVKSELIEAMQNLSTKTRTKLVKELSKQITTIQAENRQTDNVDDRRRVGNTPEVTSSTNPTSPNTVIMAPRTHQRNTRNNTPMATLPITRPEQPKRRSPRLNQEVEAQEVATAPNVNRIPMATPNIISPM